jgi:hypothetical protein
MGKGFFLMEAVGYDFDFQQGFNEFAEPGMFRQSRRHSNQQMGSHAHLKVQ